MIYNINTRADWQRFLGSYGRDLLRHCRVVAVDPDTKESGWASFLNEPGRPGRFWCHTKTSGSFSTDSHFRTLAVVESQRVFPGATQRTKSIVELARVAGVAAGQLTGAEGDIVFLDPCVWKGQIKKPTKVAQRFEYVVHQRNMANLSGKAKEAYVVALREAKSKGRDFQFEVMDAVGILLFALEGLRIEI